MDTGTLGAAREEANATKRLRALFRHPKDTAPVVPTHKFSAYTFTPVGKVLWLGGEVRERFHQHPAMGNEVEGEVRERFHQHLVMWCGLGGEGAIALISAFWL